MIGVFDAIIVISAPGRRAEPPARPGGPGDASREGTPSS